MLTKQEITCQVGEGQFTFETGRMAGQANAAVLARLGDTVVLATATMAGVREGIDFFPLLVDYEEKLYAAGKIKGSRWVKREGKAADEAILSGRVIDRSLRPLFPEGMRNDVQVITTIMSVDGVNDPDMVALNAASMALAISDIPFDGPIAGCRVGKIDGQFVINPSTEQRTKSVLDLIVSGTGEHIIMVEAGAQLVSEEDIVAGISFARPYLEQLVKTQHDFQAKVGKPKATPTIYEINPEVLTTVKTFLTPELIEAAVYVSEKAQRDKNIHELEAKTIEQVTATLAHLAETVNLKKVTAEAVDKVLKKYQQKQILEHDRRVDGRALNQTRQITCEVGVLPRTHGSALFTRGETQVLTVLTLGSKGDEQILDSIEDPVDGRPKRYIHHYNMPGYSVGEVSPLRGPGRREIGHGALAERAVEIVIPPQETFPYTLRLVSEVLSSNGSTSMASTCGSTLALMDGGVPITNIIGGCAMGLVLDEEKPDHFKVLTDIAGIEDFNGHMDFKVTGNETGVSCLQLDIKVKGLTVAILKQALDEAKVGRLHIISKMKEAIAQPRPDLSPYAPRITSFMIKPDKIREVIGAGGKIINEIIAATGVKIDIEDSGLVMVCAVDAEKGKQAVDWIKNIVRELQPGEVFDGKVTRIMDFGAFVEVLPNKEGMVHISQLANYRVGRVEDVVKVGDTLKVQVSEIDDQGRVNLTHKPFAAPAQPGQEEEHRGGFDRRHNDRRGGSGGGHRGGDRGHGGSRFGGHHSGGSR